MQGYSDLFIGVVVVIAFVVGYLVVGFAINFVKNLKSRPSLMDEIWRGPETEEEGRRRHSEETKDDGGPQ